MTNDDRKWIDKLINKGFTIFSFRELPIELKNNRLFRLAISSKMIVFEKIIYVNSKAHPTTLWRIHDKFLSKTTIKSITENHNKIINGYKKEFFLTEFTTKIFKENDKIISSVLKIEYDVLYTRLHLRHYLRYNKVYYE